MRVYAIVTGVLIMAASGCVTSGDLSRLLPDEIDGWKPGEPDGVYDADTLHDYIDGAAGVYRAFGVQAALGRRYIKPGAADILVDVFDMGSAKGAYGAYHHDVREGKNVDIGHESEYADGSLAFWKGRYFVSIIPFDGMDESREAAFKMGRTVTSGIPFKGRKPTLVKQVPLEGLIAGRLHYFRDKILLDAPLRPGGRQHPAPRPRHGGHTRLVPIIHPRGRPLRVDADPLPLDRSRSAGPRRFHSRLPA